jgi:1,4-alpha-glucan branching enzyme
MDTLLEDYDGTSLYYYTADTGLQATPFGPRPKYTEPFASQFILDSLEMWVRDFHISGFRWDCIQCIKAGGTTPMCSQHLADGYKLLQSANALLHSPAFEGTLTIAEDGYNTGPALNVQPLYANVTYAGVTGGEGFDVQWDLTWQRSVLTQQFVKGANWAIDVKGVMEQCVDNSVGAAQRVRYSESHDSASNQQLGRIPLALITAGHSSVQTHKTSMLLMGLNVMCLGSPMFLQGQEIMSLTNFDYPRPSKFEWSEVEVNLGFMREFQDMISLRKNNGAFLGDSAAILMQRSWSIPFSDADKLPGSKVAVLHRWSNGDDHLVAVFNFLDKLEPLFVLNKMPYDGTWDLVFNGDRERYSPKFGACKVPKLPKQINVIKGVATICIPPLTMLVFGKSERQSSTLPLGPDTVGWSILAGVVAVVIAIVFCRRRHLSKKRGEPLLNYDGIE